MKHILKFISITTVIIVILLAAPSFAQSDFLEEGESLIGVAGGIALADGATAFSGLGTISIFSRLDAHLSYNYINASGGGGHASILGGGGELFFIRQKHENSKFLFSFGVDFTENVTSSFIGFGLNNSTEKNNKVMLLKGIIGTSNFDFYNIKSHLLFGVMVGASVRSGGWLSCFTGQVTTTNDQIAVGVSFIFSRFLKQNKSQLSTPITEETHDLW